MWQQDITAGRKDPVVEKLDMGALIRKCVGQRARLKILRNSTADADHYTLCLTAMRSRAPVDGHAGRSEHPGCDLLGLSDGQTESRDQFHANSHFGRVRPVA